MCLIEDFCKESLGFKEAVLFTIDQQVFYSRIGYTFCEPITSYGGNIKLPEAMIRKVSIETGSCLVKPEKITRPEKAETRPKSPPPAPPPPPPPGAPSLPPKTSNSCLISCPDDDEDIALKCAKLFKRVTLKDLKVPVLEICPRLISKSDVENNKVCCRATMQKDYMKKKL